MNQSKKVKQKKKKNGGERSRHVCSLCGSEVNGASHCGKDTLALPTRDPQELSVGVVLHSRFQVTKISHHRHGILYVNGGDLVSMNTVLIKVLDPAGAQRQSKEIDILDSLFHMGWEVNLHTKGSGIPAILDHGYLPDGRFYSVTSPCLGLPLMELNSFEPTWDTLIGFYNVFEAVDRLHENGFAHSCIDALTVVRSEQLAAFVLVDFDAARPLAADRRHCGPRRCSSPNALYMAPEVLHAFGHDYQSPIGLSVTAEQLKSGDIWSLAGAIYQCVTGQPPISVALGLDLPRIQAKVMWAHIKPGVCAVRRRTLLSRKCPSTVADVLVRALRPVVSERYATALEFRAALFDAFPEDMRGSLPVGGDE